MKRNLTHQEEQIIRLHHHDFKGLTVSETAKICNLTEQELRLALREIKRKAPQLFPILSPRRVAVRLAWENGLSQKEMVEQLGLDETQIKQDCNYLYKHKFISVRPATIQYANHMDNKIVQRF